MPLPVPEAGLVISYDYLWHREFETGQQEGLKDRPSVIVMAVERRDGREILVTVLPITHSPPKDSKTAIEVPQSADHAYGMLPPKLFSKVAEAFRTFGLSGKARLVARD